MKRIYDWCSDDSGFLKIDKRKRVRCPTCNRRLLPMEVRAWIDGDFIGFKLPGHKTYKTKAMVARKIKPNKDWK